MKILGRGVKVNHLTRPPSALQRWEVNTWKYSGRHSRLRQRVYARNEDSVCQKRPHCLMLGADMEELLQFTFYGLPDPDS